MQIWKNKINKSLSDIKFMDKELYEIKDHEFIVDGKFNMFPISFYSLYVKEESKIIIFNYKIFEEYDYEPKAIYEFDVKEFENEYSTSESLLNSALKKAQDIDRKNSNDTEYDNYDYNSIEFKYDDVSEKEYEEFHSFYWIDILSGNIDNRITQFLEI